MDEKKSKRFLTGLGILYWVMILMIFAIAHRQFRYEIVVGDTLSPVAAVGEITDGVTLTQQIAAPAESLTALELMTSTYGRDNSGVLNLELADGQGNVLYQDAFDVADLKNDAYTKFSFDQPLQVEPGEALTLTITSQGCQPGGAVTVYFGNSVNTGRFDVVKPLRQEELYRWNGQLGTGKLCVRLGGVNELSFYLLYWPLALAVFALLALYTVRGYRKGIQGQYSGVAAICVLFCRYEFLLEQLVTRDFKVKYKRSVLGMAWSFLNPLMTMLVQYIVFSKLFRSNIENYPVYLLTGIVFFNFFSEAVSLGMNSITGNAPLIKKVYMPKYIYPVSRLLSSSVNFALALIPLLLVMLFTGTPFRPALLLLVFDILCMMMFVMGMILLMSTAMTFFQDTQFLWGVLSMIWMYLTPVFYPESIIPANLMVFYKMNPLYQYITFARTCIIEGTSPGPLGYLWCLLPSLAVLGLGIVTFKKQQDKFVLYL